MSQSLKIRWVLAHEPIELFVRAAKVFAASVEKIAPGQLDIEILTLGEYSERYQQGRRISKHDLVDLLDSGEIEMSQTYTTTLGKINRDFHVLDLPFLFRDHDHAARVFESEVGQGLLDSLEQSRRIKGLAFTYSGGFRIIPGNEPVAKIEDLRGMKVRTSFSPVAIDTFRAVGAEPVPMELEELTEGLEQADVTVGESTYPRVYALGQDRVSRYVNHTEHSLFLTTILVGTDFWSRLSPQLQQAVSEAAVEAARYERQISVDDILAVQEKCARDGIAVIAMSPDEQARFAAQTRSVYDKYQDYFTAGLVESIKRTN